MKSAHNEKPRAAEKRKYQKKFTKPTMTKQAMADECDINNIMRKFEKTGILTHVRRHGGNYGDFTNAPQSYHEAYQQILDAEEMFMEIPASIRKKFDNDPGKFLAFVEDPKNEAEMEKLGLLNANAVARRAAEAASKAASAPKVPEGTLSSAEGAEKGSKDPKKGD